ncbi:MAG: xanthine dehydrogenase small subunit [Betaproteobacteria bacterium]|nr:xanthine dehydrogenase small subunit [Betaproteobacteria bacterium]NBY72747.1 xanthine dehydrogenase small subunit [Betaproteobacteria bacterium]NDD12240.1 xanthine dehydrogenase small subunit [Betaproteobacteria bacterium]
MNTLRLLLNGQWKSLSQVPPARTLLEVLREDLELTGTKEGCASGDCGACTVLIGQIGQERLELLAINSCIRPAHAVNGLAVWTVEDLNKSGNLHPAQEAMVRCHGSQCGFCTPGFVMSMVALYENTVCQGHSISRDHAQEQLSGNLCRCTGYRPILDAALMMNELAQAARAPKIDRTQTLSQLKPTPSFDESASETGYLMPNTLSDLLSLRAAYPKAQLIAGATDVGLWITKQQLRFDLAIDLSRVDTLRRVEDYPHHIAIGAAVPLAQAFEVLVKQRPMLKNFFNRFAGQQVRNSGTLGGNVANGSPIGDSMPLLIALGANLVLMRHSHGQVLHREVPLENFYTGYRKNILQSGELLAWIKVPKPQQGERLSAYKVSKRYDDDISAVCAAIQLKLDNGLIVGASVGVGGVADTPKRALKTEALLQGQPWTKSMAQQAGQTMQQEFEPLSDLRASADYRRSVLQAFWQRFWLESQGLKHLDLSDLRTFAHFSVLSESDTVIHQPEAGA